MDRRSVAGFPQARHRCLSPINIDCQRSVLLKPAFDFLNRHKDLAAASNHAPLVPYVLIEEVARHRRGLRAALLSVWTLHAVVRLLRSALALHNEWKTRPR
jgi:hypothetical protein